MLRQRPLCHVKMVRELCGADESNATKLYNRSSELLLSIPTTKRRVTHGSPSLSTFSTSTPARSRSPHASFQIVNPSPGLTQVPTQPTIPITPARHPHAPLLQSQPEDVRAMESELEYQEDDIFVTARACLESREFLRAVHLLRECKSSKARFLSIYCQFIVSLVIDAL